MASVSAVMSCMSSGASPSSSAAIWTSIVFVALAVIDNAGDDRHAAVLVELDKRLGPAPDAHGETHLHRVAADADAVEGRQLAKFLLPPRGFAALTIVSVMPQLPTYDFVGV